jgi:hypothetical protein
MVVVLTTGVGGNERYLEGTCSFCHGIADLFNLRQLGMCVVLAV